MQIPSVFQDLLHLPRLIRVIVIREAVMAHIQREADAEERDRPNDEEERLAAVHAFF